MLSFCFAFYQLKLIFPFSFSHKLFLGQDSLVAAKNELTGENDHSNGTFNSLFPKEAKKKQNKG